MVATSFAISRETQVCPVSHRRTKIVEGASQPGGPLLDFDAPLVPTASSHIMTSLVAQMVNCLPTMRETRVPSPGLGRSPWRRKWQPTPVFLPGESHRRRSLVGYSPRGCKELDTTEQLNFQLSTYDKGTSNT